MPAPRWSAGGQKRGLPPSTTQNGKEEEDASQLPLSQTAQLAPPTQLERTPDCINRNSTPDFSVLCNVMDRMRTEEPAKRRAYLTNFMNAWREKVGPDLYPLIRLLLPDRDRERPVYNLKEMLLAKCYIEVLGLDKHSESAQHLVKWKQPAEGQAAGSSGDFARVCFDEIKKRSTVEAGTLSVEGVNTILDALAKPKQKQADYVTILRRVNEQCTAAEQEWIIRIILKDLRISIREKGVFSCFHPDAATLFNVCSDLKRVCWTLYRPDIRLEKNQTDIELFRCFLPQLCYRSPSTSNDAIAKLVGAPRDFIIEEKLDGERMQLHMRGSGAEWFYCSRKAKDYTYLYGSNLGEGSLTQHLAGVFNDDVKRQVMGLAIMGLAVMGLADFSIILDGEMMVWDPILEKYLAFGTLKTAAGALDADENSPRPCFKVFDVLSLNGVCLADKRLSVRKQILKRAFQNLDAFKGRIELVNERVGNSGKDILEMLQQVLEARGEGIVVKKEASRYVTNSRGADWIKIKPEYADQMGENLDLIVLGGWWGKGGRTGKISSLLCGLRVPQDDDGSGETPKFTTFCKVGSGMSYEDYEWILKNHKDHWRPFDRQNPPPWMEMGAMGTDDKPDVYINPSKSFVMEVKASEIVPAAGGYGAGYTLRFPRCRFIHWDRASRGTSNGDEQRDRDMWNCLSFDELKTLLLHPPKRPYVEDKAGTARKKRKVAAPRNKIQILESFRGQRCSPSATESSIFSGLLFVIPKDVPGHKKEELEALVTRHGGNFSQAQPQDNSAIFISHDLKTPRVGREKRLGRSIVKPEWIFESIKRRRPLPLLKELLVFASEQDKDGRYYNRTLAEIDQITLVRDRGGVNEAESEVDPDEKEESDKLNEKEESDDEELRETEFKDLAEEWGTVARPSGQHRAEIQPDEVETSDEEDRKQHYEEEDYSDDETFNATIPLSPTLQPPSPSPPPPENRLFPVLTEPTSTTMAPGATNYDEDKIFTHLVFYIDTSVNAHRNGLAASSPPEGSTIRLREAETLLRNNGGEVVDNIDDPRLTHVIMDDEDAGRYVEIFRRTSKPKYKHIVLPSWVCEGVEEDTIRDEEMYKPS